MAGIGVNSRVKVYFGGASLGTVDTKRLEFLAPNLWRCETHSFGVLVRPTGFEPVTY